MLQLSVSVTAAAQIAAVVSVQSLARELLRNDNSEAEKLKKKKTKKPK